jgi:hypothetical protein
MIKDKSIKQGACYLLSLVILLIFPFSASAADFNYKHYAQILDNYVHEGKTVKGIKLDVVDYEGIFKESQNPSSDYSIFLKQLSQFNPVSLKTREEKIAFWINAYNIGAMKMIIDHYPVDSIRSRKISFLKNPWKIKIVTINGKLYSLGQIEHEIILGKYRAKMAHFAIVCASLSCPDISKDVYRGNTLKSQLEKQARIFINNKTKGLAIDRAKKTVYVSKIFKWDEKNFPKGADDIVPFITPFVDNAKDRQYLQRKNYQLQSYDYDWDVNSLQSAMK